MNRFEPDEYARRIAAASVDPTGWFEELYTDAADGTVEVPWDRGTPHPLISSWRQLDGHGRIALVVGCGLGEDSEYVASRGFTTTAFDISPTAIRTVQERFPDSEVRYLAADLLHPPAGWRHAFDLVVESLTVQSLPRSLREVAISAVGGFVAPGGTLLVVSGALGPDDDPDDGPPWRLTRAELESFARDGLETVRIEEPDARWRAEFRRRASS